MAEERGRHARDAGQESPDEDHGGWRVLVAKALLVGGRVLPFVTVAVVTLSRLTQASWERSPLDDAGFTTAWAPNLAGALSFVLGFALPVIVLPVGSSVLSTRDAGRLTVRTVLGRRTIDLAGATTWRARLPGRGSDTQLVLVWSRTGWAILAGSEYWLDDGYRLLDDVGSPRVARRRWIPAARGWVIILLLPVVVFAIFGAGGTAAGLF
ncbi:hypothetical protein [Pengzhenrongella sp.]|uniref:hypothetical protein n=1 Tax=Pengzhenrongella sp. TaxID=2888820 RepID=UPI002F93035F